MFSKMDPGGIPCFVLGMIQGRMSKHDCKWVYVTYLQHFMGNLRHFSYQRLYFRNLNHPIARASVVTRRQESRYSLATQNRSVARLTGDERRHVYIFPPHACTL